MLEQTSFILLVNAFLNFIPRLFAALLAHQVRLNRRWHAGLFLVASQLTGFTAEVDSERAKNLVIVDPISVQNLRIETITADDRTFEQVIFAVGRVEAIPAARAVVSSAAAGRVLELKVAQGDPVAAGAEVGRIANSEGGADSPIVSLSAPIDGLVTGVYVRRGEAFRRIKTLVEITNLQEVDVVARVPEHDASLLQPGSVARIRVPAACDKIFKAQLVRFGTEADRKHGTVEAYYRLANRDLLMRPGMRAEFRIIAAEHKVSAVPRDAVQGSAAQRFVFVKDYELPNAFVRVPVVVGQRNDRFIEIVSGLMPGDEVVTTGAYALSSAGRGSINLKAALDAAHGHPHHQDGTPMNKEPGRDEGQNHGATSSRTPYRFTPATYFFATLSFLLLGLLYLSRRHRPETPA